MINYVKSHTMTLAFILQADINQIFQMRYCMLLWAKRLQKYQRSKLEVEKNLPDQPNPGLIEDFTILEALKKSLKLDR